MPPARSVHPLLALALLAGCAAATPQAAGAPPAAAPAPAGPARLRILALNDFHGQITPGRKVRDRPVGSAPVLAAWLRAEARAGGRPTLLVHAGDLVGGSPAASALLHDTPALQLVNLFAGAACRPDGAEVAPVLTRCDVVGTVGNHELDHGLPELLRQVREVARFPYVAANLVDARTGKLVLPPYAVVEVDGVQVAFVGAVLRGAPAIIAAGRAEGLAFLDEAESVNRWIPEIQRRGVHAIVVLLHDGGHQPPYRGQTQLAGPVTGPIVDVVGRLDGDVDVVVSAHTHQFTNALLPTAGNTFALVTQAFAEGSAFAAIDLDVDRRSRDVTAKSARIVTAWADEGPGRTPDPEAAALLARAEEQTAALTGRPAGTAALDILRAHTSAGESALGSLVADAQRAALGGDVAFTNPGGLRADLPGGPVTWGTLFAVQPFGNAVVKLQLTGAELLDVLEAQWRVDRTPRILPVSGLTYAWSFNAPVGRKVSDVRVGGKPLDPAARYAVVVNAFLAGGGDGFQTFTRGRDRTTGPTDVDALAAYVRGLPQPFVPPPPGRIRRLP